MRPITFDEQDTTIPRLPIASDVLKGAIAGAAATWIMNQATTVMYERESEEARDRENQARGGMTAYARASQRIAHAAGVQLTDSQSSAAGTVLHWSTGIGAAIAYAAARRRWPAVARAGGLPFGVGFFLAIDEGLNTALGITPPPGAFPWQAHARGAAGHVVFGLVTHGLLAAMDRLHRPRRRIEALLSVM